MNKIHGIHMLVCFIYLKIFEAGILVSGMWTVWEYNNGCVNQYMCALDIYLMTVLSYSYGFIMYRAINEPGHGNNVVGGLNEMEKRYLKGKF